MVQNNIFDAYVLKTIMEVIPNIKVYKIKIDTTTIQRFKSVPCSQCTLLAGSEVRRRKRKKKSDRESRKSEHVHYTKNISRTFGEREEDDTLIWFRHFLAKGKISH